MPQSDKGNIVFTLFLAVLLGMTPCLLKAADEQASPPVLPEPPPLRILQIRDPQMRFGTAYPYALPTLLAYLKELTGAPIDPQPEIMPDFSSPEIFQYPIIYVNAGERKEWKFSNREQNNLRNYLERGGFLFIDAGITAEFLRTVPGAGQHHSFAEWRASPEIAAAFAELFPGKSFQPIPRSHPIFRMHFQGLPDASRLPETVRTFVVREKWPQGTYSLVGLHVNGRIGVLCSPILAMGWGKNQAGLWQTTIGFRIREEAKKLDERLESAAYVRSFPVKREDGREDMIYCQQEALPAWVKEADGRWRVFRYYNSREISEFAHLFYTRLGVNIFLYAITY